MNEHRNQEGDEDWPDHPVPRHRSVTRLLVCDWTWRLFDEDLGGREFDFPVLGWRRIWIEESRPGVTFEVREWHFGRDHPAAALLPAPAWQIVLATGPDPNLDTHHPRSRPDELVPSEEAHHVIENPPKGDE